MLRSNEVNGGVSSDVSLPNVEAEAKVKLLSPDSAHLYPDLPKMGNFSKDEVYPGEIRIPDNFDKAKGKVTVTPDKSENGVKVEKIEIECDPKCKKCVHWTKIVFAFVSWIMSVADIVVIIYVSYLHFSHSSDIIAWLMLLPILLNFIGIFTFLSDDDERHEMESLGCQNAFWKNMMFLPVVGPSVCSLKLFVLSFREHEADRFERLESLTIRMKQYESFFRAAPEAFVQLTFRIITWSRTRVFNHEDWWTNLCLTLCFYALAESHMYGAVVKYYRMFTRDKTENAWSVEFIPYAWRVALFILTFLSVASRLYAESILKATLCFYFHNYSFGEVMIVTFLFQFVLRAVLYSLFVSFLGTKKERVFLKETGVYGAFTYSWRSLFMSFDFQSQIRAVHISFYLENLVLISASYAVIFTLTDVDLSDKYVFNIYAIVCVIFILITMLLRTCLKQRWRRRVASKIHAKQASD